MRIPLLFALGACGRIGFGVGATDDGGPIGDAVACAMPVAHDEDNDTIDDACDPCPHVAGDTRDRDGDGVGDACDPLPDAPTEKLRIFDSFASLRPAWVVVGSTTIVNDALAVDGRGAAMHAEIAVPDEPLGVIEVGITVRGAAPTGQRQVSIAAGMIDSLDYAYCEIESTDGPVTPELAVTTRIGTNVFTVHDRVFVNGLLENTSATLRYTFLGAEHRCDTSWPPVVQVSSSAFSAPPRVELGIETLGVDMSFHYFVFIESQP